MIHIDPTAIGRLLTPNQRNALLWLAADGSEQIDEKNKLRTPLWGIHSKTLSKDITACLARFRTESFRLQSTYIWHATDLGLKVRRAIETHSTG